MPSIETPQAVCRLGIARADITPPVGIYHRAWGAATHDRATGVHRPLVATALVLAAADGGADAAAGVQQQRATQRVTAGPSPARADRRQVIVALDHCLLWPADLDRLATHVCRAAGVSRDELLLTFSHTHAAGLMDSSRADLPGGELIGPYLARLADQVAGLVREAVAAAAPATIAFGAGRCALAANRDFWDAEGGQHVCGLNPQAPADDTLLVARATDDDGRPLATLVNYACHPTTLAWQNTLLSPDFPGAMRALVERETGVPCLFLQGASGDLGPREGFTGDVAVADRNGRALGFAALAALEGLAPPRTRFCYSGPVVSGATLGTWTHAPLEGPDLARLRRWRVRRWAVELAVRDELRDREAATAERDRWRRAEADALSAGDDAAARHARAMHERAGRRLTRIESLPPGGTFPLPVTLVQTGDALWLAVEGEPYNVLQRALRARFAGAAVVVMALAGGSRPSYLPTAETYGRGIYQESIAMLAAGSLERLIESLAGQIAAWGIGGGTR